jgi:hypothetical protein
MNNTHKNIQFKMTTEENNPLDYLDLTIMRHIDRLELDVFRKPMATSTTIHAQSSHPMEHKIAAYRYYTQCLHNIPIFQDKKKQI